MAQATVKPPAGFVLDEDSPSQTLPPGFVLDQPSAAPKTEAPTNQPGFGESFYNTVQGPRDLLKGLNNLVTSPRQTLGNMGQGTIDLGRSAIQDFRQGNYVRGAQRALNTGLNAVLPGFGTASSEAGEDLAKGNYAEGAGKTLGAGVNAATAAVAPRVVPRVLEGTAETITPSTKTFGQMRGPIGRAITVDPRVAMTRALRPPPSDPGFSASVPQTLARIREANKGVIPSGVTNGQLDLIPATKNAIATTQGALEPWMNRAAGVRISGEPIVQATREATSGMLPSEGTSAEGLINRAHTDFARDFTPEELRDRLALLNKRLNSFYSTSPGKQSAALADIPEAVLKAQRDATADALYKALDPEGEGAGPRLIQGHTGDLINIRDAMLRRNNAIVAEQPLSKVGRLLGPVKNFAREILPTPPGTGLAFADASEGRTLPLINRSFKAVGSEPVRPLPRPGSTFYPAGNPQRLIGPGIQLPEPTELPSGGSEMRVTTGEPLIRGYGDLLKNVTKSKLRKP